MQAGAVKAGAAWTWRFPRMLVHGQMILLTVVWGMALLVSLGISLAIDRFEEITGSVWEAVAGIGPWFTAFIGGYIVYVMVPAFIANGRTRRDSFIEWLLFSVVYPAGAALLVTLGYMVEAAAYRLGDWTTALRQDHLFSSHTDVGRIFLEYLLTLIVWTLAGGFVGGAVYRWPAKGWMTLVPASIVVGLAGEVTRTPIGDFGVIADRLGVLDVPSIGSSLLVSIPCAVVAAISTWYVIRNMPLRTR
jgi:hypothetical protein